MGLQEWGNGLVFDASDEDDAINLQEWPTVKGMYQPDAIVTFKTGGQRCEMHGSWLSCVGQFFIDRRWRLKRAHILLFLLFKRESILSLPSII